VALPHPLHHGAGAAPHRLGATPCLPLARRAGHRVAGHPGGAEYPEDAAIHSQVLHDVLARLDQP